MSTTPVLPEWIWKKKYRPAGVRLAKFPKWEQWKSTSSGSYNPTSGKWGPYHAVPSTQPARDNMPDLWPGEKKEKPSQDELRFWMGSLLKGKEFIAVCRSCGYIGISRDKRNNHLKGGCGAVMMETIRLLKKKKQCICCGAVTNNTKWGLHFCDDECKWEYAFEVQRPEYFDVVWRKTASDEVTKARMGQ